MMAQQYALRQVDHDEIIGTGKLRDTTELSSFVKQLQFSLNRKGLDVEDVCFLNKHDNPFDAKELLEELRAAPNMFDTKVIPPCALFA